MAAAAVRTTTPTSPQAEQLLLAMDTTRARTLDLVADLDEADLERVLSPIMSPLTWDLGHIAAYEDLWLAHRAGGLPLLRPELAALYDAFETPRAVRGEVEALSPAAARRYMADVRLRSAAVVAELGAEHEELCERSVRTVGDHSGGAVVLRLDEGGHAAVRGE